jgi:hypothetical protein
MMKKLRLREVTELRGSRICPSQKMLCGLRVLRCPRRNMRIL